MYTWTNSNDAVLVVVLETGRRRTLRTSEIVDLIEMSDTSTEVIYRSGARIAVPLPFDALYAEWMGKAEEAEWAPR